MPEQSTFILVLEAELAASGTGTVSYTVSNQERLSIREIFQNADGIFNITDIRDSVGYHYTNASLTREIPSVLIAQGANEYNHIGKLPEPIVVEGGQTIYIDLEDTSVAGNTVKLIMPCIREYPTQ